MTRMKRNYKENLFRMIFREKEELLSLYNAISETHYDNPKDLVINTLENAVFMGFKNDISFLFDFEMYLLEHQSTFSPNMPLRNLFYAASLLEKTITEHTLYSSTLLEIPTPRFFVFYNGTREQPERRILKLSDAFQKKMDTPELELTVTMLNINAGYNRELQEQCKTLKDYVTYVQRVRIYAKEMDLEAALKRAVDECIKENILGKFFAKYKREVIQVSILEYDAETEITKIKKAEYEYGVQQGLLQGKLEGKLEGESKLITIMRGMLDRDMTSSFIADMLKLEESYIGEIISLIQKYPEFSDYQIAEELSQR